MGVEQGHETGSELEGRWGVVAVSKAGQAVAVVVLVRRTTTRQRNLGDVLLLVNATFSVWVKEEEKAFLEVTVTALPGDG